ncbi:MAG: tetratricopeptide repeat protein [Bacteroidota bacterium]
MNTLLMRFWYVFVVFFMGIFSPSGLTAQQDSLLFVVANPPNDTADINALYSLVKLTIRADESKALDYALRMGELADARDDWRWAALGYRSAGVVHWVHSRPDSAYVYYQMALARMGDPARDPRIGTGLLTNLGGYHQVTGEFDEAVRYFAEAFELGERTGYVNDQPKILNNLGALYRRLEQPESARRAYEMAIRLKEQTSDSLGIATTLANLGKVRLELGDVEQAERDLARSKQIYTAIGRLDEVSSVDILRGNAHFVRQEHRLAREIILVALEDPNLKLDPATHAEALLIVAETYRFEENFTQALDYLERGASYAKASGLKRITAHYDRAFGRVYRGLGRTDESSAYFANFSESIDTVINRQRIASQRETAESFQAQLREAEIERQQLIIAQQKQGQRLLWLSLGFLALLTTIGFLLLRSRLKYQHSEARRMKVERAAEVNQLRQEAELGSLRSMIQGQEAERRRVAKDLHDGLGGLLATVKAHLSTEAATSNESNKLIDRACTEVRRIAHNMMPQTLALSGLSGAVQDIAAQLNQRGLDTEVELIGQPDLRLDDEGQATLLRIIQELTHNVVKHAQASKLFIQLLDQPRQLLLTVEDDGVGFNADYMRHNGGGLGLNSIDARVTYLKGHLQYDSSPGHGTTVTLTIPL